MYRHVCNNIAKILRLPYLQMTYSPSCIKGLCIEQCWPFSPSSYSLHYSHYVKLSATVLSHLIAAQKGSCSLMVTFQQLIVGSCTPGLNLHFLPILGGREIVDWLRWQSTSYAGKGTSAAIHEVSSLYHQICTSSVPQPSPPQVHSLWRCFH